MLVMQYQFFQRAVQVVGLCEAVARDCLVDDAVLDLTIHTVEEEEREREKRQKVMNNAANSVAKHRLPFNYTRIVMLKIQKH